MMGDLLNSVSNDVYSIRERLHEQIKVKHLVFIKTHLVALVSNVFKEYEFACVAYISLEIVLKV